MMKPAIRSFSLLFAVACRSGGTVPATSAPLPVPGAPPALVAPRAAEAAADWQLLDATRDGVAGTSVRRAERELLAGRTPGRTVIVAVLDGGIDTAHVDLRANLWTNPRETPGNGRDDDNNGFVDDAQGWNFLGGRTGDVNFDTLELTREHLRCRALPATGIADTTRTRCATLAATFAEKRTELQGQAEQVKQMDELMTRTTRILRTVIGRDSLTVKRVEAMATTSDSVRNARQMFLRMASSGITPGAVAEAKDDMEGRLAYGYNLDFNGRAVVGDDVANVRETGYGNRNIMGPDAMHGSHVAGIIGGVRGNGTGVDGVAPAVRLMVVRTVPNGDERDKDVANAIRYAVDNGAHIINMSFGKGLSPDKAAVDAAVQYAVAKGVLLVHAAGNDGADLSTEPNFPNPAYLDGARASTWIEVGASSWKGGEQLAASFSNYGKDQVDVFAPGEDILSTVPGGGYRRQSGTSMAAPVVSGLAALLMGYFPALTAADVKRLIMESATSYRDALVVRPGSDGTRVRFGDLSRTGGVVNAWAAVKAAMAMTRVVP